MRVYPYFDLLLLFNHVWSIIIKKKIYAIVESGNRGVCKELFAVAAAIWSLVIGLIPLWDFNFSQLLKKEEEEGEEVEEEGYKRDDGDVANPIFRSRRLIQKIRQWSLFQRSKNSLCLARVPITAFRFIKQVFYLLRYTRRGKEEEGKIPQTSVREGQ